MVPAISAEPEGPDISKLCFVPEMGMTVRIVYVLCDFRDLRNDALKVVAADGLRTCAPHRVLEPFIFGAGFETQRQVELPPTDRAARI